MKKMIGVFLISFASIATNAQTNLPFCIKASFGYSKVKNNTTPTGSGFTYGMGIETFLPISKKENQLLLNPSLDYNSTGYDVNVSFSSNTDKVRVNYVVLAMPVVFNANPHLFEEESNSLLIGIGPFVGYATSGKFNTYTNSDYTKMSFGNGTTANRKATDAGITFKLGITMGKTSFNIQKNTGLMNVMPKDRISNGEYIRTKNFMFQLTYKIN
jgi:hypothetical protein